MKKYFNHYKGLPIPIKRFSDISAEPLFVCYERKFGIKSYFDSRKEPIYRGWNKKTAVKCLFSILPIVIILTLISGICISMGERKTVFAKGVKDVKENFELHEYSNDKLLLVVNPKFPMPQNYELDLCDFLGIKCDKCLVNNLKTMLDDAETAGLNLEIFKGFIDRQTQEEIYNQKLNQLIDSGYTIVRAEADAEKFVSSPGKCEYETGLLIDIRAKNSDNNDFVSSEEFKWLINNGINYGFIQRYPTGKENKTGKNMSPFVFRFVGVENAKKMRTLSMCFDEYVKYLNAQ